MSFDGSDEVLQESPEKIRTRFRIGYWSIALATAIVIGAVEWQFANVGSALVAAHVMSIIVAIFMGGCAWWLRTLESDELRRVHQEARWKFPENNHGLRNIDTVEALDRPDQVCHVYSFEEARKNRQDCRRPS